MTNNQAERIRTDLSRMAGESVTVEEIKGTVYAFCTELGALRLFHKYNSPKCRAAYSPSLKTWYCSIECK